MRLAIDMPKNITDRGIFKTPGVMGGSACVNETRIPVWLLVQMTQMGVSESELLENYPTLSAQDIHNALAYYDAHQAEIDDDIYENENA